MSDSPRICPGDGPTVLGLLVLASGILGVLTAPATAQGIAAHPPALGMAVPLPDPGMANGASVRVPPAGDAARLRPEPSLAPVAARPSPKRPHGLGGVFPNEGGQLPNQRTGHRHEHVVRDICIGC